MWTKAIWQGNLKFIEREVEGKERSQRLPWSFYRTMGTEVPFDGGVNKTDYNASLMKKKASYDISLSPWPCNSTRSECESFTPWKCTGRRNRQPETRRSKQMAGSLFNISILRLFLLFWDDDGYSGPDIDWTGTFGSSRPGHDELVVFYPIFIRSSRCKHGWYCVGQVKYTRFTDLWVENRPSSDSYLILSVSVSIGARICCTVWFG